MKTKILILLISLGISARTFGQGLANCKAWLHNDTLTLENELIYQNFKWNNGNLIRIDIGTQSSKKSFIVPDNRPAIFTGKAVPSVGKGSLVIKEQAATPITEAYLSVEVISGFGNLEIKRIFRIFPNLPAMACNLYLKGNISNDTIFKENLQAMALDKVRLKGSHWKAISAEFFDVTDRANTLVQTYERNIYNRGEMKLRGNVLTLLDGVTGNGLFLLKEAPTSSVQLSYPGYDFLINPVEASVIGPGMETATMSDTGWIKAYGTVIGLSLGNNELGILTSLRKYQQKVRIHLPLRDEMILMNTWGDMSKDARVNEAFAIKEIEAGARIGVTHLQLDDGWQTGRSANSAFKGGSFSNIWRDNTYWQPHPERFPNGLEPVVKKGKEMGIEICVWFNPSGNNNNENWEKDANVLIGLYNKYGIRTFKIDGVSLPTKLAEVRFRMFLDKISAATNYTAVFNLDVTAGRRGGYHYFNEYGNLFLENRFTDWHDYFPYYTLRNLWMLSKYVPPQTLQIEFLNKWRNPNLYTGDPFGPANYSFSYVFAIAMMAQPLAWFEATGLPDEAFNSAEMMKTYGKIQNDIHKGVILPIGNEPDGKSWTGFQSMQEKSGYFLVFREMNDRKSARVKTWLAPGTKVKCVPALNTGKAFSANVDDDGCVIFSLDKPNSFVLYKYTY